MNLIDSQSAPTIGVHALGADTVLVVLAGEHDIASAPELEQTLDRCLEGYARLVVELSDATFIDSTTIHLLLNAAKRAEKFNVVCATAPIVERVLEVSGVREALHVVGTVEQALLD